MSKALVVATVGRFLNFESNDIKLLKELGYEVDVAANYHMDEELDIIDIKGIRKIQIDFCREPFSKQVITAYKQLKRMINDNDYSIIHCHTPVAGVLTRLAARQERKKGCRVIYTVHGLQFCKGESVWNWLIYYPIESFFSRFADAIITINKEDYSLISKKFHNKITYYIPGVGIDTKKFDNNGENRKKIRDKLGLSDADVMLFTSGEISRRKNQQVIIKAMAKIENDNLQFFIAGKGSQQSECEILAENLNLKERVHFLGYRNDIPLLLEASDIFVFPSIHEGLGISLLEAMASGVPCVATGVQGINDLINEKNLLHNACDVDGFADSICKLIEDKDYYEKQKKANKERAKLFDVRIVENIMRGIYTNK